ncbi:MAG TPA: cytochrome c biogenesis protein CcsA [Anaeromyxobacteraceae bacterium]|jgi:ABC-type transport system involved in cytochrome c biogenesis permease subunit|nr:cytochrome c biogenesis protein CcsA [Anaeromyxobacteraceae bacterium]
MRDAVIQSCSFWAAVAVYALSTVLHFAGLSFERPRLAGWGRGLAAAGLAPHACALALRWAEVGHGPWNTRYEVLSSQAFVVVALWLVASVLAPGLRGAGALVVPCALLLLGWAVSTFGLKTEVPIVFKSCWLALHVAFAKLFAGSAVLASACAVAYLRKRRRPASLRALPRPEVLDLHAHQLLLLSFLCLGVMIVAGSLWANQAWGRYWAWDPMETSSLATWIAFAVILHLRVLHRWSGPRMAWLTLLALAFTATTLYAVAAVVPTIHASYMVTQ